MKCILVEANDIVRVGIKSILLERECEVEALRSYQDLLGEAPSLSLIGFAKETAAEAYLVIEELTKKNKSARIICMSAAPCFEEWQFLSRFGVLGYCTREISVELLLLAIQSVEKGATFLCPFVSKQCAEEPKTIKLEDESLSKREQEVLKILANGASNQDIAKELGISIETVKAHVKSILSKMEVNDRTQAAVKAIRSGLVSEHQ
ncbi:MAG: response regulator transcription factor [Candidatus Obscuribacterales bacterium]|nr:response regulator transcription factor [Candidatus Obscuribacterales bacterium]